MGLLGHNPIVSRGTSAVCTRQWAVANIILLHFVILLKCEKRRIWCYPTSNPVLQLKHHCQVPEKNPNTGMMPSSRMSLFVRPPLALGRTTLPLPHTFPNFLPCLELSDHLPSSAAEKLNGRVYGSLVPSSFIFFCTFFFKNTCFIYSLTQPL